MTRLPRVTAKQIVAVIEKCGFVLSRQSGSHMIFKRDAKRVTIPFHSSTVLHPKTLRSILRDIDMNIEKLEEML